MSTIKKYFTVPRNEFYFWFKELVKSGDSKKLAYKKVCKFYNIGINFKLIERKQ